MPTYLLYRVGANRANQGDHRVPVAIVEARNQAEATATEIPGGVPDIDLPSASVLAPEITCWANQHLEAVPQSRAPDRDWNSVLEDA